MAPFDLFYVIALCLSIVLSLTFVTSHFTVMNILLPLTLGALNTIPRNWLEDDTLMPKHVVSNIIKN
jgi:hypothetical protein